MTAPGRTDWVRPLGSTALPVTAVAVGGAPLGSMPENFGHEVRLVMRPPGDERRTGTFSVEEGEL